MTAAAKPHVHSAAGGRYLPGCPGCQAVKREASRRHRSTPEGRAANREASRRHRSTPEGREAHREAARRRRSTPEGREAARDAGRKARTSLRARTPEQADQDFAEKWPDGRPCPGCGEVLPAEAYQRNFTESDGRERRCNRNGCRHRHHALKQRAKLEAVWAARGLPTDVCGYCLAAPIEHIDHFHPSSKGGPDHPDNYVGACPGCNLNKSDRDPFEWLAATHPSRLEFFRALFPEETA